MDKEQSRNERIETLYQYFLGKEIGMIDPILYKARAMYPMVREATLREYASTVLRMLQNEKDAIKNGEVQLDT